MKNRSKALTAAENQLRELKEKERSAVIEKLLKKMSAEEDRFNQVTFYTHTTVPQYDDTRSYIIPYIGRTDSGYTYLCWYCDYTGDDWIFWDTMTFIIDGTITVSREEAMRMLENVGVMHMVYAGIPFEKASVLFKE